MCRFLPVAQLFLWLLIEQLSLLFIIMQVLIEIINRHFLPALIISGYLLLCSVALFSALLRN